MRGKSKEINVYYKNRVTLEVNAYLGLPPLVIRVSTDWYP